LRIDESPTSLIEDFCLKFTLNLFFKNHLRRASIGFMIRPVDHQIAAEAGMSEVYGVVIDALFPDGAADRAGLQSLDIILSVDGYKVKTNAEFQSRQALFSPGDTMHLEIYRNREVMKVDVVMAEPKGG
jgi:S1-C subfamily serine protease